jgi:hypothetical protein
MPRQALPTRLPIAGRRSGMSYIEIIARMANPAQNVTGLAVMVPDDCVTPSSIL